MNTKQIPNSAGQTPLAAADLLALPPGPGKAQASKRAPGAKDFATVIDQAASGKSGTPAHVRTPKSTGRGRREDLSAESARERNTPDTRESQSTSETNREEKPTVETKGSSRRRSPSGEPEAQPGQDSRVRQASEKVGQKSATKPQTNESDTDSAVESTEQEVAASAENATEAATPANVIPFPGTTGAVIIPFPVAQAQAVQPVTQQNVSEATPTGGASASIPTAVPATTAQTTASVNAASGNGAVATSPKESDSPESDVDVAALGMKPVTANETIPTESFASEATPTLTTASDTNPDEPVSGKIVPVTFNRDSSGSPVSAVDTQPNLAGQTQLPGASSDSEESARPPLDTPASASSAKIVLLRTDAAKPAPDAAATEVTPPPRETPEAAGTSGARQEGRMESSMASQHAAASNNGAGAAFEAQTPSTFTVGNRPASIEAPTVSDFSDRTKVATDWQSGRPVSGADRPVLETTGRESVNSAPSVERIASMVLREATLVKKYSSDSMAVVLRPDAETELFVHLTHRNGQVEATVRCERGDAQHLGALWPQLQESLAQQKVRLAPLEDPAGSRGNTNFQPPAGSLMSGGGERGTRQEARPSQQSMDEWPATPAPVAATPHVRGGRGTRGRRISTSRPGWETWA